MTPKEFRLLIPAAREAAYLNTATYGPASELTVGALRDFADAWSRGTGRFEDWADAAEGNRALFAELIKASPDDIAIQPYVSGAAGLIGVQLRRGDRVVVNEIEFASNLWPWLVQRERGVEVAIVPARGGYCEVADYAAAIGDRVALVAVSAFQSSNGWRAPLRQLADLAHAAGGLLFVDACQGAGAISLDPARDGFDLLAADSYKWLMGPRGSGYMYLPPAVRDRFRPIAVGAFNSRDHHSTYYGPEMELSETASRFDTSLSWMSVAGDRQALQPLVEIGIDAIQAHDLSLADRFRSGIADLGLWTDEYPEAGRSPVVAVAIDDPAAAVERLSRAGVVVAKRAKGVRFSFHVFNNESDVDRALEALA